MSATVIPASQAHFRVLDYMGGDSTITEFPVTFCLLFLQSSCPCDVFESSRCSKMNANSQVLCITDFDTFKKLSILSKILRVYSHLVAMEYPFFFFVPVKFLTAVPFFYFMLLGKTLIAFCSVFQKN